jgi:hypothetical protein
MSVSSQRHRDSDDLSKGSRSVDFDGRSSNSKGKTYAKISDRLLEPTQSNIFAMQKLHSLKEEPKDDIWFTERGKAMKEAVKSKEKYDNVTSKLFNPTESFASFKLAKSEKVEEKKSPKPIDPGSRVLMPTTSYLNIVKKKDDDTAITGGTYTTFSSMMSTTDGSVCSDLRSKPKSKSGEPRFLEPTYAALAKQWKPKADIEIEEVVRLEMEMEEKARLASPIKVSKPSERLLEHTVSSSHNTVMKQNEQPGNFFYDSAMM